MDLSDEFRRECRESGISAALKSSSFFEREVRGLPLRRALLCPQTVLGAHTKLRLPLLFKEQAQAGVGAQGGSNRSEMPSAPI
jgi:hypothetical protein